eukprot:scaffold7644_cov140-Isochrysis_galbana.AAC.1
MAAAVMAGRAAKEVEDTTRAADTAAEPPTVPSALSPATWLAEGIQILPRLQACIESAASRKALPLPRKCNESSRGCNQRHIPPSTEGC